MPKEKLEVFARIKPCPINKENLPIALHNEEQLILQTNRSKFSPAKDQQRYCFEKIFDQNSEQEHIFSNVARPVIDNCLKGYNGTIFAYGQTGSGKTYTMSGGDCWEERGIIPRVLSYIFGQFRQFKHQTKYEMSVSYVEIYNQNAYDLLDENNGENNFQQWPKITLMEDEDNRFFFRNGSSVLCRTEEEAVNYLMMGNYLRKISCTSLNQASSRSHCIFVLNIRGIQLESSTEIFSKINLVDLAGSERVSKSHAEGLVLTEAKSINLSLSYLQQVIVSLNQKSKNKSRPHIPYRNSLLTTLLKDSLGGNCKTVMIATISSQADNLEETLSTLRFSQRVRQIKNQVSKNEKNSLATKIQMLERQNSLLKRKLQNLQSNDQGQLEQRKAPLSEKQIQKKVEAFMNEKTTRIDVESTEAANFYFLKMKELYTNKMKEYVEELTFISEKIVKYDQMLDERERKKSLKIKN